MAVRTISAYLETPKEPQTLLYESYISSFWLIFCNLGKRQVKDPELVIALHPGVCATGGAPWAIDTLARRPLPIRRLHKLNDMVPPKLKPEEESRPVRRVELQSRLKETLGMTF